MANFSTSKLTRTVVVGVLVLGLVTTARATDQNSQQTAQQPITITPGELSDHPDRYYGKRVTVTGEVEDVYSRSVFALDEDRLWSTGRDVLVVNPNAAGRATEDGWVTVQGVVRQFNYTDVDNYLVRHGWQWDLATVYRTRFATRPVVIADSIMEGTRELVIDGNTVRSSAGMYGKPMTAKPDPGQTSVVYTTPGTLSQHPDRFYGKTISIIGHPEDTFGTMLFSIDENRVWSTGEDVLVLATGVKDDWEDLNYVQIKGKVMRFSRDEVQRRLDKDRQLSTWWWTDFGTRPVIVAESIIGPDGRELMKGGVR